MRYIIGIDLGTTNCTVSFVDSAHAVPSIQSFAIPQLVATGYTEHKTSLPSFCYIPASDEFPKGSIDLPWKSDTDILIGKLAQTEGARVPTKLVQSAKSWLCHPAANRRDKILPFDSSGSQKKISPIEATSRYLQHIKDAWNHQIAKGVHELEFQEQEIIVTVPASFDEVARALTAEAAKKVGLTHLTLLEEPQAAFYAWLSQNEAKWQQLLPVGSSILVCDVGGGTTDFSLIEVSDATGSAELRRMSVGDHLLLGGDNIDSAIAYAMEKKLVSSVELSLSEWSQLKQQARLAKEHLLQESAEGTKYTALLQGKGASVVKGSRTVNIEKNELEKQLLDGFFGIHEWDAALKLKKRSGIRTLGLPYEEEPSITKHLANFLNQSHIGREVAGTLIQSPDFVLFNGGTMKPKVFQNAIIESLKLWFKDKSPQILTTAHFDSAVSRGAAYYGKVRRGLGVRISGGAARGFYLGLDIKDSDGTISHKALTLLPRGSEEGTTFEPHQTFSLKPNVNVQFQMYTSHVRLFDASGDLIEINAEELHPLPTIHTQLLYGKKSGPQHVQEPISVHLCVHLNAIGILELSLVSENTPHRWLLEFQLRTAAGQENTIATIGDDQTGFIADQELLQRGASCVEEMFANNSPFKPTQVMDVLEKCYVMSRQEWTPNMLRSMWDPLCRMEKSRLRSNEWGARWWNLVGFALRPGFGCALDDFRCKELWKIILTDMRLKGNSDIELQKCICLRRVAGGLSKGQQLQIAHELMPALLTKKGELLDVAERKEAYSFAEKLRTVASLELIDVGLKEKLGKALVTRITKQAATPADYWALGRLGARHLFYGSISNVIPQAVCCGWIESLLAANVKDKDELLFTMTQLARKSDCREINIPESCMQRILNHFSDHKSYPLLQKALSEISEISAKECEQIFGEKLPAGLTLQL